MNASYLTSMHALVQKKRFNYHVCIIHNVGGGRTASKEPNYNFGNSKSYSGLLMNVYCVKIMVTSHG